MSAPGARRLLWIALASIAVLGALWLVLGGDDLGAGPSTLSRASGGWLGVRLYLEARGTEVELIDQPLREALAATDEEAEPGLLVLAFPLQRVLDTVDENMIHAHLRRGGDVLLAPSGRDLQWSESEVLGGFDLLHDSPRGDPPLLPWEWWRFRQQQWSVEGEGGLAGLTGLEVQVPDQLVTAPRGSSVLLRAASDEGQPLAFEVERQRGRLLVLPAELLANGRLTDAGHGDLLETLRTRFPGPWRFDEFHHGLVSADAEVDPLPGVAWDLFAAHLGILYLLAVLRLGRRFGPAWREPQVASGSAASFLRNLGALHGRLGHHREAAEVLLERTRQIDPEAEIPADLPSAVAAVGNDQELVEVARRLATLRRRRGPVGSRRLGRP